MAANLVTRPLAFDSASLLAMKMLAFVWMVLDHVDLFFNQGQAIHATVGRLVFPLFGVVFAYNLARMRPEKIGDAGMRLLMIGAVSQILYAYLQGALLPFNVLWTLSLAAMAYVAVMERRAGLGVIALVASVVVDYATWGVLGVAFLALAFRAGEPWRIHAALVGFVLSLGLTNGTQWALLALPIVYVAAWVRPGAAPRLKWLFYVGYPVHLLVLALVKLGG